MMQKHLQQRIRVKSRSAYKERKGNDGLAKDKGQGQDARRMTKVSVPKSCQLFADRYRAWCSVNTNADLTGVAGTWTHSYQVNNFLNGYGPQLNYAGGFSTNVPSGMMYLVGSFSGLSSGLATAPYNRYLVLAHEVEVSVMSSGSSVNTIPIVAGITYSQNSTGTQNMAVTQIPEQPHTRWASVPNSTTAGPIRFAINAHVADLFGVKRRFYEENHGVYGAPAGSNPSRIMYAHVWVRAADGTSTALYYTITIRHRFLIELSDLNGFATNAPSFVRDEGKNSTTASNAPSTPPGWFGVR